MRRSSRWLPLPAAMIALAAATGLLAPGAGAADRDPVIVAVGDIACQSLTQGQGMGACRSGDVADLIREIDPDRFLALGDLQYNNGKLSEFLRVWDVQFGDLREITMPAPGNHEYGTPDAGGYFAYFGAVANPPLGYYSFDLGDWHIVSLNSDICGDDPGCGLGTPQGDWLRADLEANADATCTLAFMHHPRYDWRPFQSGSRTTPPSISAARRPGRSSRFGRCSPTRASTSCSSGTTMSTSGGLHRTLTGTPSPVARSSSRWERADGSSTPSVALRSPRISRPPRTRPSACYR